MFRQVKQLIISLSLWPPNIIVSQSFSNFWKHHQTRCLLLLDGKKRKKENISTPVSFLNVSWHHLFCKVMHKPSNLIIVQNMLNFMTLLEYQGVRSALPIVAERKQHLPGADTERARPLLGEEGNRARHPEADEEAWHKVLEGINKHQSH